MLWLITALFTWLQSFVRSRHNLGLEIVALRHQLVVLKRRTKRAPLQRSDRLFWILLRQFWPHWAKSLLIVKPETVVGWHRQGRSLLALSLPEQNSRKADHVGRYSDLNPDHGARKLDL